MTPPSVGERVDQLERDVAELARQNVALVEQGARQAQLLAALLFKLGESAEAVPGEVPLAPDRTLRARGNKAN